MVLSRYDALYGRKQFLIEILEGTKVISRKKGFTTKTCVTGVPIGQQTPQFESLPLSAKVGHMDCLHAAGTSVYLLDKIALAALRQHTFRPFSVSYTAVQT